MNFFAARTPTHLTFLRSVSQNRVISKMLPALTHVLAIVTVARIQCPVIIGAIKGVTHYAPSPDAGSSAVTYSELESHHTLPPTKRHSAAIAIIQRGTWWRGGVILSKAARGWGALRGAVAVSVAPRGADKDGESAAARALEESGVFWHNFTGSRGASVPAQLFLGSVGRCSTARSTWLQTRELPQDVLRYRPDEEGHRVLFSFNTST